MTNANQESDQPNVKAQLNELLKGMQMLIESASEDQQRRLLSSLQELEAAERRKHRRKSCSIPVSVGTWRVFREFAKNISRGGMFIGTSASFSPGEHVTLTFSPPNQEKTLRVTGRVVRRTAKGIGVEFTSPPSAELREVIESL
ncbi:MAG: PilZ domain-containing protein [Thermodesulfobacteriota bacterium]|nr:PilZ domain-containing protein [Thermodesulfobacteriota bacterium]